MNLVQWYESALQHILKNPLWGVEEVARRALEGPPAKVEEELPIERTSLQNLSDCSWHLIGLWQRDVDAGEIELKIVDGHLTVCPVSKKAEQP